MRKLWIVIIAVAIATPAFADPRFFQQSTSPGIINIGQIFGDILAPYINALVDAIIVAGVGWVIAVIKKRTGIQIDAEHRAALTKALENQAGSLIADGKVAMQGKTVSVDNAALGQAANELLTVIPDAASHFGLTPDYVAKRIVDTIPQIAAGAQMIAKVPAAAAAPPPPAAATPAKA